MIVLNGVSALMDIRGASFNTYPNNIHNCYYCRKIIITIISKS